MPITHNTMPLDGVVLSWEGSKLVVSFEEKSNDRVTSDVAVMEGK
jgi:hypothetical protein